MTFEEHIRSEHNMWHYLYFIVLIKVKDPTEFTGPESYVHQMVKVSGVMKLSPRVSTGSHRPSHNLHLHLFVPGSNDWCSALWIRIIWGMSF